MLIRQPWSGWRAHRKPTWIDDMCAKRRATARLIRSDDWLEIRQLAACKPVVGEGGGSELRLDRSGVPAAVLVGDRRADGSSANRRIVRRRLGERAALSGFLMSVALIVPLGLGVGRCARLGNLLKQFTEICQNTASLAVLPDLHPVSGHSRAKITM